MENIWDGLNNVVCVCVGSCLVFIGNLPWPAKGREGVDRHEVGQ